MVGLYLFEHFMMDKYLEGKDLLSLSCKPMLDGNKKVIGTRVDAVIIRDDTVYKTKDGAPINNLFEKIRFKVGKVVDIPPQSRIMPVNPVGKVYGDFRNNLSVTCDDIQILSGSGKEQT